MMVPWVWSKISIAPLVEATLRLAAAVRITLWPDRMLVELTCSDRCCSAHRVPSVLCGTLGWTASGDDAAASLEVMSPSAHAAADGGTGLPETGPHTVMPSGVDGLPGVDAAASSWSHAAPGPESGHCRSPSGTVTCDPTACASWLGTTHSADKHVACTAGAARNAVGGAAASATNVAWLPMQMNATARWALRRKRRALRSF